MTKIIKLTEAPKNDKFRCIYVNVEQILNFSLGEKGKDTHLRMTNGCWLFVRESCEEIQQMINEGPVASKQAYDAGVKAMRKSMTPSLNGV